MRASCTFPPIASSVVMVRIASTWHGSTHAELSFRFHRPMMPLGDLPGSKEAKSLLNRFLTKTPQAFDTRFKSVGNASGFPPNDEAQMASLSHGKLLRLLEVPADSHLLACRHPAPERFHLPPRQHRHEDWRVTQVGSERVNHCRRPGSQRKPSPVPTQRIRDIVITIVE